MAQVSKKYLPKETQEKLFDLFFKALANIRNPSDIEKFLFSLLGPTEKTMLAKRLGIALLLAKGYNYETIKDVLKVSQETIARVNGVLNYRSDGYEMVIGKALRDEQLEEFLKGLIKETISAFSYSTYRKWPGLEPPKPPKHPLGGTRK